MVDPVTAAAEIMNRLSPFAIDCLDLDESGVEQDVRKCQYAGTTDVLVDYIQDHCTCPHGDYQCVKDYDKLIRRAL